MEKELFHENLEALYERFGKESALISLSKAAAYVGCDPRTLEADKSFPVKRIGKQTRVPLISLARWLA